MVDPVTPIEAVNQPNPEPGILDKGGAIDNALNTFGGFFKPVKKVAENTVDAVATGKIFSVFDDFDDKTIQGFNAIKLSGSDNERVTQMKELTDRGGFSTVKDILGGVGGIAKNSLGFNGLKFKDTSIFKDDTGELNNKNAEYAKMIEERDRKKQELLQSADFSYINELDQKLQKEYFATKGVQQISDIDDFNRFKDTFIQNLGAFERQKLDNQIRLLNEKISHLDNEINDIKTQRKNFFSEKLEGGEEEYNKYLASQEDEIKNNKTFKFTQDIRQDAVRDYEPIFAKNGVHIANMGPKAEKVMNAFYDDVSDDRKFMYGIIASDMPNKDKLAGRAKELSDAMLNYKMESINAYSRLKGDPNNAGASDVDLFEKAYRETYHALPESQKEMVKAKNTFTQIAYTMQEKHQLGQGIDSLSKILDYGMNGLNLLGGGVSRAMDMSFDIDKNGVPLSVAQEMRNITYSNEGFLQQGLSIISHNPDELLGLFAVTKGTRPLTIGSEKLIGSIVNKTDDALMKIPMTIGYGKSAIPIASKGLQTSGRLLNAMVRNQIEGGAQDPIIDIAMQEAPGKLTDEINRVTNILFDTSLFSMGIGAKATKTSGNRLMYEFITNPADKEVISQFAEYAGSRGIKLGKTEAKEFMEKGKNLLIQATSKEDVSRIFNEPGKLYDFISSNLKNMEGDELDKLITEKGILIDRTGAMSAVTGIDKKTMADMGQLFSYKESDDILPEKKALINARINKEMDRYIGFTEGKALDKYIVQSSALSSPEFIDIAGRVQEAASVIKMNIAKPSPGFNIDEQMSIISEGIGQIQTKFTNVKRSRMISLVDQLDPKKKIDIDLDRLEQYSGMSYFDLVKNGTATIKNSDGYDGAWKMVTRSMEGDADLIVNRFVRDNYSDVLKEFVETNKDLLAPGEKVVPVDSIIKTVENLLTGKSISNGRGSVSTRFGLAAKAKDIESANKIMELFIPILQKISNDFFSPISIGEKKINVLTNALNINKAMDAGDVEVYLAEKKKADIQSLTDYFAKQDGILNISYGTFYGEKGEIVPAMYLSFGKDMGLEQFKHKLTGKYLSKGDKTTFANYLDSSQSILKEILEYGSVDGKIDFELGLRKAKAMESINSSFNLFQDGKISRSAISDIIKDMHINENVDDMTDAVMELFSGAIDDQNAFLKPMIINFLHNYSRNIDIVDDFFRAVRNGSVTLKQKVDAISNLILSNKTNLFEDIAKKKRDITDIADIVRSHGDSQQNTGVILKNILNDQLAIIENQISKLKRVKSSVPERSGQIMQEISKLESRSDSIKKEISTYDRKIAENTREYMKDIYHNYLVGSANKFASDLFEQSKTTQRTIDQMKENALRIKEEVIPKVSMEERKSILTFITEFQKHIDDGDIDLAKDLVDRHIGMNISKEFKDIIDDVYGRMYNGDMPIKYYDRSRLIAKMKENIGTYDHEFLLSREGNPITRQFRAMINETATGQDREVSQKFSQLFGFETYTNPVEMYANTRNTQFRDFIDGLYTNDPNNVVDARKMLKEKLSYLYEGSVFKTNLSNNAIDDLIEATLDDKTFIDRIKRIRNFKKTGIEDTSRYVSLEYDEVFQTSAEGKRFKIKTPKRVEKFIEVPIIIKNLVDQNTDIISFFDFDNDLYKKNYKNYSKVIPSGYIYVGNYGDKDSVISFYRMPQDVGIFVKGKDWADITKEFYGYEYAYKNGFSVSGSFDEFKDAVKGSKSLQEFQAKVDAYNKKFGIFNKDTELYETLLPIQTIRKREAPMMSTSYTFDDVKIPVRTLILEKDTPILDGAVGDFIAKIKDRKDISSYTSQDIYKMFSDQGLPFSKPIDSKEQMIDYIDKVYMNDMTDGTAFVSNNLINLRDKIRGTKNSSQFKDHFYGDIDGKKILGKALYNRGTIKIDGKEVNDIVAIGASSLKLKGGKKLTPTGEVVTINEKQYKVVGEIEGADTSFFKNASSDSFKHEDEITAGDSVKTKFPLQFVDEIEAIQKDMIQDAFQKYLGTISDYKIKSSSFNDVYAGLTRTISNLGMGVSSPSFLKDKLKSFFDETKRIIDKPQDAGQEIFIRNSDIRIGTEEVLVSRNSDIYRKARSIRESILLEDGIIKGSDEWNTKMNEPYFTVGFRYPVPSKFNPGVYKIRLASESGLDGNYKDLGPNQVVLHPQNTYMKLEADNDGDHVFFLPSESRMGNVYTRGTLNLTDVKPKDLQSYLSNTENKWKNEFIYTPQVEKGQSKVELRYDAGRLIQSRGVALMAKNQVGTVAATIRSVYFIAQAFDEFKKLSFEGKSLNLSKFWNQSFTFGDYTKSFSDLWNEYGDKYKGIDTSVDLVDDMGMPYSATFRQESAKMLQMTVDFGASDADSFPTDWINNMLKTIGIEDKGIKEVIEKFSMNYGRLFSAEGPQNGAEFLAAVYHSDGFKTIREKLKLWYPNITDSQIESKIKRFQYINKRNQITAFKSIPGSKRNLVESIAYDKNLFEQVNIIENNIDPYIAKNILENLPSSDKKTSLLNIVKKYMSDIGDIRYMKSDKTQRLELQSRLRELFDGDFKKQFDYLDSIYTSNKKDKYQKLDKIYALMDKSDISDIDRMINMYYAHSLGEQNSYNFLAETMKLDFIMHSDAIMKWNYEKLFGGWKSEAPRPILSSYRKIDDYKNDLELIKNRIVEMKSSLDPDEYNATISSMESEIIEINEIIKNVDRVDDIIPESGIIPATEPTTFNIPETKLDSIVGPHSHLEVISDVYDYVGTAKQGVKLTMQSLYSKYAPQVLQTFDDIQGFLNMNSVIDLANRLHVEQFSDLGFGFIGDKKSIYRSLKSLHLTEDGIIDISRKIQKEFLTYSEGEYGVASIEMIQNNLSALFLSQGHRDLTLDPEFMKRVAIYAEGVIAPVADSINQIQRVLGYDLNKAYEKLDFSMVTDIIEAAKGDPQLALKLNGIENKEQFVNHIRRNAESMGANVWDITIDSMVNVAFKSKPNMIEKFLGYLQAFHYQMSYGTLATVLHQGNVIAGMAQIMPNLVELKAFRSRNASELAHAGKILAQFPGMGFENTLLFGTGHGKNISDGNASKLVGFLTKTSAEKGVGMLDWALNKMTLGKLGISKESQMHIGNVTDSFVNNMLGFNDYPLENMRKLTAIMEEMDRMGIKNYDEFMKKYDQGGDSFVRAFYSRARVAFVNSGGGAVSSSPIGRATVFDQAYAHFDNALVRFFVQANSYLMGWSYHKMSTLVEKETAMVTGIKRLLNGDVKGFRSHMYDWISYNAMLGRQFAYTAGLYLKFQKFEDDNNDRMDFMEFQENFNNIMVAFEIMLGRHIDAWNTASEYGDGIEDNILFTALSLYKRTLRLFKQPEFIRTMYDKYRADVILEEAGGEPAEIMKAFQFSLDQHYKSFMTFSAMQHANDVFDSISNSSNLGVLGVGGQTNQEELLNKMVQDKTFASFKDKGFITSLLTFLSNTLPQKNMNYNVSADISKRMQDIVMKDKDIRSLVQGGEIGKDYLIQSLIGDGKSVSDSERIAINTLWKEIQNYKDYYKLDEKGRRILDDPYTGKRKNEAQTPDMLEKQIDLQLAKEGKTWEDLFNTQTNRSREDIKSMAVMAWELNISTPRMISYVLEKEYQKQKKELIKIVGVSESDNKYKVLPSQYDDILKRQILIKYQSKFNLDRDTMNTILEQHIIKNHSSTLDAFTKEFGSDPVKAQLFNLVGTDNIVHQVMKNGDTSVKSLWSKYALAYKNIPPNETGVKVVLKHLKEVEDSPWMDRKTKTANQAAMIFGMGKVYDVLKNNKEFEKLTTDSQKLITNWLYKISSDANDYDANSPLNSYNSSLGSKPYLKPFKPAYKSNAYSDKRPNYSKQFNGLKPYMNGKEGYIDRDPNDYINKAYKKAGFDRDTEWQSPPITFNLKVAQMPRMLEYAKHVIQKEFYSMKAPYTPKESDYVAKPKIEKMKIGRPKKSKGMKGKKITGRKPPKHYSRGVRPNLPFSNYEG